MKNCPDVFTFKSSIDDYFEHEFVHFREFWYAIKTDKEHAFENISHEIYSREILKKACFDHKLEYTDDIISSEISEYASFNPSEAIAEALSGGNTKLCKRIEFYVKILWR